MNGAVGGLAKYSKVGKWWTLRAETWGFEMRPCVISIYYITCTMLSAYTIWYVPYVISIIRIKHVPFFFTYNIYHYVTSCSISVWRNSRTPQILGQNQHKLFMTISPTKCTSISVPCVMCRKSTSLGENRKLTPLCGAPLICTKAWQSLKTG